MTAHLDGLFHFGHLHANRRVVATRPCLVIARALIALSALALALLGHAAPCPPPSHPNGLPKPAYPVILVHGIDSNADDSWGPFREYLCSNGWTWGGSPTVDPNTTNVLGVNASANFYALNFSTNNGLGFFTQGFELSKVIRKVLDTTNPTHDPAREKVILVAHSMGGLAARAYVQSEALYQGNVDRLITIGTPNQGSMLAKYCHTKTDGLPGLGLLTPNGLCNVLKHPDSVAIVALAPNSTDLTLLNSNAASLFQTGVQRFVSIVVDWGPTLTDFEPNFFTFLGYDLFFDEQGDGVVTVESQDLARLFTSPDHVQLLADYFSGAMCTALFQVHTCETQSSAIWQKITSHVLAAPLVAVSTDAASVSPSPSYQVTVNGTASFGLSLSNAYFRYGTGRSSLTVNVAPPQLLNDPSGTSRFSVALPGEIQPGATYYYQLVAEVAGGVQFGGLTVAGEVREVRIPPSGGIGALLAAPTGLSPADRLSNQSLTLPLSWNSVANATFYRVMLALDPSALPRDSADANCTRCLINSTQEFANLTSYTVPPGLLSPGTKYYWQVHAGSATNVGVWTDPFSFTTQSNVPATVLAAPVQISPSDGDTGQTTMPTLTWTQVAGATSYRLMIASSQSSLTFDATSADCPLCIINAVVPGGDGTTFVPYPGVLEVGVPYYWSVKARSPNSFGAWSTVRSFTPNTQAMIFTEFRDGIPYNQFPNGIAVGPDRNIWFTTIGDRDSIWRITPLGIVSEFNVGNSGNYGGDIRSGPDGNLWYTASNYRIGRITPSGIITEFNLGTPNIFTSTGGLTAGPDGNIWFTANGETPSSGSVRRITPSGSVTEFRDGISGIPRAITTGSDRNLWFTESSSNRIGRITTAGVVTYSAGLSGDASSIAAGPDGNLWFTESSVGRIGRITPTGVVTEFTLGAGASPYGITAGPDGNLWFTEANTNRIGRITPAGLVTRFTLPTTDASVRNITAGADGHLWVTDSLIARLWRVTLGGATSGAVAMLPSAPTARSATAGDQQAMVAFTIPVSNGGSVITAYTVTCNPGNTAGTGPSSPIVVTALTNGTVYSCSITATNSAGTGPASNVVTVTPAPPITLLGAVSRKTHISAGTFDLTVDVTQSIGGSITVEPRQIGAGHSLVFSFDSAVTSIGSVSVVDASNSQVGSAATSVAGNNAAVTLSGIPDNQRVRVSLTNVNNAGVNTSVSVGFLLGDVNSSRSVDATDPSLVKSFSGQVTNPTNYLSDLNLSGAITASDILAAKGRLGLTIP